MLKTLETERLILREWRESDVFDLHEFSKSPDVMMAGAKVHDRILKYAFGELDLMVVAVCHYPLNVKSKRVIEKCGFTYEGTLRKYSKNLSDSVRYSMTKEEWEDNRLLSP